MRVFLTDDQLKDNLKEQIHFLNKSSESYDAGEYIEAKRLATHLRILLYDRPFSHSLLTQLKKHNIKFWNSSYVTDDRFCRPMFSLLFISKNANNEPIYEPILDRAISENIRPKIDFESWWNQTVIIDNNGKNKFSRKYLLLKVAQEDGGAHVDPSLDKQYVALSRENSLGIKGIINEKKIDWDAYDLGLADADYADMKNKPELATIRQIAYEVLITLKDEFPDCF